MRHLLAYLALRLALGILGLLSAKTARRLGRWGGKIWHLFDGGRREMARRHMARILGPGKDPRAAAVEVMESYGRYFAEALWVDASKAPEILDATEVHGLDALLAARDTGKGMILALPHMGNWEVAAPVAVINHIPIVAVAERLANERITDWFTELRAEFGIEVVLATGRAEVMRRLESALHDNKAVALLSDRDIKGRGVEVEFFGEMTTLPPGPATLALRTNAPLFPVATYFTEQGYRATVRPALEVPEGGSRSERVQRLTQELAAEMEKLIMEAPTQWHLVQPNWPSDRD
ncbi:MAG: phosphatidylinositol mannoside acyltransferase [Actinobacteria bacterium]|nr:phosphatidylinositol mannoside acyltransferase [Actinomycetota bacterium]